VSPVDSFGLGFHSDSSILKYLNAGLGNLKMRGKIINLIGKNENLFTIVSSYLNLPVQKPAIFSL
jgi:hypothetical protein